jgi:hypothetical protein
MRATPEVSRHVGGLTPELTTFPLSAENHVDRRALRTFLASEIAYEQARRIRAEILVLLTVASTAVWVLAMWPSLVAADLRDIVLGAWGLVFIAAVGAGVGEWLYSRRARAAKSNLTSRDPLDRTFT